jgi:hypothetical protein
MAKRGRRVLPARKKERDDDSLLIRSAESLGRVIGSLQRQVRGRAKRVTEMANDVIDAIPSPPRVGNPFGSSLPRKSRTTRKAAARKSSATSKAAGSRKRSAARRSSKKR